MGFIFYFDFWFWFLFVINKCILMIVKSLEYIFLRMIINDFFKNDNKCLCFRIGFG